MPFITSKAPTYQTPFLDAILVALNTRPADALFASDLTVHLYTAGPSPINPNMTDTDFTEADFVGYTSAVVDLTAATIINLPSGNGRGKQGDAEYTAGAVVGSQTLIGYYVTSTPLGLICAEEFPSPIPIVRPGDFISLDLIIGMPYFVEDV